jgi:transcriptional regulator with XRE-family HTH domain
MIKKEKLRKISRKLSADQTDYMTVFRENLFQYVDDKEITLTEIADKAGIPLSTLNSFLYGNTSDPKLSTVVKLSRALEISIDELIGAETITDKQRESISICRNLPEHDVYLVRWFIRYLEDLNRDADHNIRTVSVMRLEQTIHGGIKLTSDYHKMDISELDRTYSSKIFFGIILPCDYYMPKYSPLDVLFIANDRTPTILDDCLIRVGNQVFLATRKVEEGVARYYSIRDGKYRLNESEIDELIGYIAYKKPLISTNDEQ